LRKGDRSIKDVCWQVILSGHSGCGTEVNRILTSSSKPANLKAIILFDAESMRGNITTAHDGRLEVPRGSGQGRRRPHRLSCGPATRARLRALEQGRDAEVREDVRQPITAFMDRLLSKDRQKELDALKARQACVVMPDADRRRLAELRRKKPGPGAEREELKTLEEKAACKPLTARDRTRFDELTKRESQLQSVTAFLPTVRQLYQVTPIDADTLEHEEIIRGAREGSGDYQPGQGNLEKALKSIP